MEKPVKRAVQIQGVCYTCSVRGEVYADAGALRYTVGHNLECTGMLRGNRAHQSEGCEQLEWPRRNIVLLQESHLCFFRRRPWR